MASRRGFEWRKDLNPIVAEIHHEDSSVRTDVEIRRTFEFTGIFPRSAEDSEKGSVALEHLDTMVFEISNKDPP